MIVVGAGMAGMLAATMLRGEVTAIVERQDELPNNHSAVLRFRTKAVSEATNIAFKEVDVIKAIATYRNPIADAVAYSMKTNGTARLRSIKNGSEIVKRYIAPRDFIEQLYRRTPCPIAYGQSFSAVGLEGEKVISTIPMPILMQLLGWVARSDFRSNHGTNIRIDLGPKVDLYCSLYVPDPELPFSRISVTGEEMILECTETLDTQRAHAAAEAALGLVGIPAGPYSYYVTEQKYAKILPIDEAERKEFIMYASQVHGIYSLGRFATWRPGLLLDDVVNDVRVIQRLISNRAARYDHLKKD